MNAADAFWLKHFAPPHAREPRKPRRSYAHVCIAQECKRRVRQRTHQAVRLLQRIGRLFLQFEECAQRSEL